MLLYQAYYNNRPIGEIMNIRQVRVINACLKNIKWEVIL